jgi:type II secretory pathway component PulK
MFCPQPIKKILNNKQGVALFIVLASMATLAIFVGEITYTAAINQKLAYDRLDQIKAHALAKSGLRLALLRIRAYSEIKRTIAEQTKGNKDAAAVADAMMPKAMLEKIWSEPITIPFTGDVSALPSAAREGLLKFRKDSGMEGNLYIAIDAQSSKFNLNTLLPSIAAPPTPTPTPKKPGAAGTNPAQPADDKKEETNGATTDQSKSYDSEKARSLLIEQLQQIFTNKFETDTTFRDQYRNLRIEDLGQEMIGWADIGYETLRSQQSTIPFKMAPYYDISELHYLPTVDDQVFDLISPQFTASTSQGINVNSIQEPVLRGLVPQMTEEERKEFFEYRDAPPPDDHAFKTGEDFVKYLSEKVAAFKGSATILEEFKTGLSQRGITLVTDESHFKVRIEATIQQTKRTLEAWVSVLAPKEKPTDKNAPPGTPPAPTTRPATPQNPSATTSSETERSNLKITQLRIF